MFLATALMLAANPAAAAPQPMDDLEERLASVLERASRETRGLSVVVELGGQTLFAEGEGRFHFGGNEPALPRSLLPAAGLADFWTALAAMALVEDGRLDLDAKIDLPGLEIAGETLTVRQLLTHSTGIPSPATLAQVRVQEAASGAQDWSALVADGLTHTPDSCQVYSSGNTWVLGALVERASGKSFADAIEELVLEPAGLRRTGWTEGAGEGLDEVGTWIECAGEIEHDPTGTLRFSAADLVTTPADLARLLRALADREILSDVALGRMTGTHRLADGTPLAYAFGWNRSSLDEFEGYCLGASNGHEHLHAAWYPSLDLVVTLGADTDEADLDRLERRLVREVFDLPGPAWEVRDLPEGAHERYPGVYHIGCNRLEVLEDEDGFRLVGPSQPEMRLHYVGGNRFLDVDDEETILQFQVEGDGPAHAFVLDTGGVQVIAVRVDR